MSNSDTDFQYISEFDVAAGTPKNALPGGMPRDLEQEEFLYIQARRIKAYTDCEFDPLQIFPNKERKKRFDSAVDWLQPQEQHERSLVGVAISGGGIRSATFGLGVLQGLAELELLRTVDYLSTVSGGGFIGSWLAAWIKREGNVTNVAKQLMPERDDQADAKRGFDELARQPGFAAKAEPEPIFHLREFSNYLSPKMSFFSGDSWTLVTIYLRNLLANQLVLLPFVTAILLLIRLYVVLLASRPPVTEAIVRNGSIVVCFATIGLCTAAWLTKNRVWFAASIWVCGILSLVASCWFAFAQPSRSEPHVIAIFGPPAVLSAIGTAAFLWVVVRGRLAQETEREWLARFGAWLLLISVCWVAVFGISLYGTLWFWQASDWLKSTLTVGWIASAIGGISAARSAKTSGRNRLNGLDVVAIVAPLLFLVGLGCAMSFAVNRMIGMNLSQIERSQIDASTKPILTPADPRLAPMEVTYKTTSSGGNGAKSDEIVRTRRIVETRDRWAIVSAKYWKEVETTNFETLFFWLAIATPMCLFFGWRVDVNEFSLNAMYANRVARCYLGASRRKSAIDTCGTPCHASGPVRTPDRVTGFDPNDDFNLHELRTGVVPDPNLQSSEDAAKIHPYWGPFPLINTAMNLVSGDQLAWQERKAESFVLSPLYCGGDSVGYRDTFRYSAGKDSKKYFWKAKPLTLGRAVAISGAAASPNMGYHTSPSPAALMTIFNVRLGWWLPNPRVETGWMSSGPLSGLAWIFRELFGFTDARSKFVNISDGGHFENLGVYELVRRRCRFIVVSDAGADPNFEFEDLAGLIRKCRTDFGVDIEIDINQLRRRDGKHSDVHCAIGTIRYDHVEPTAPVGTLIYIKPSLTGDEPADIQHYAGKHPDFPHQATLDQFFNESQFESYRALGYHCATKVFGAVAERLNESRVYPHKPDPAWIAANRANSAALLRRARVFHDNETENLFYFLRKEWLSVPQQFEGGFLKSVKGYEQLQKDFATDPKMAKIDLTLYPELKSHLRRSDTQSDSDDTTQENGSQEADPSIELHTASRMLQVMEDAWLGSQMNLFYAHPLNSGWMNVFQRWGNWPALRRYWPLLRNEYSRDFVRFCEHKLALKTNVSQDLLTIEKPTNASEQARQTWLQISSEFQREWPPGDVGPRGLDAFIKEAWVDPATNEKAFYYVRVSCKGENGRSDLRDGFVGGILALRELTKNDFLKSKDKTHLTEDQMRDECAGRVLWTTDSRTGYELLVWVRPAFRQQSIGTELVEKLIEKLFLDDGEPTEFTRRLGGDKNLRIAVLYPKAGWTGEGDDLEKMMWLSFFSFYGFRRPRRGCPHAEDYEVLTLDVDLPPAGQSQLTQ